jgi:hypothetical protein
MICCPAIDTDVPNTPPALAVSPPPLITTLVQEMLVPLMDTPVMSPPLTRLPDIVPAVIFAALRFVTVITEASMVPAVSFEADTADICEFPIWPIVMVAAFTLAI